MAIRRIAILGATGSIGTSALSVVDTHRDRLQVVGLAAGNNVPVFAEQVRKYAPRAVALASERGLTALRGLIDLPPIAASGADGLIAVATHPDVDILLCASSGTTALEAVLAAIECGKTIALANKEVLVMNLILAVIVLAAVLMQGANAPAYMNKPATIGVVQPGSPAEKAGVRPGDVVTRLGSAETATWEQLEVAVAARPERELQMVVIRDGREERLTIRPETTELRTRSDARFEIGTIGVLPDVNPHIRALLAGQPAEQAGLKAGDVILSIDGQRMMTMIDRADLQRCVAVMAVMAFALADVDRIVPR